MSIDATKWTSDWAVGREIAAAYEDSGRDGFCLVCIGDPATPSGFLVEPVGDELARYHPDVFGTSSNPVHRGNLAEQWEKHGAIWRSRFTVVLAPKGGLAEEIGMIVPTRIGWVPEAPAGWMSGEGGAPLGHMTLYATVFFTGMEEAGVPANPHLERRARQAANTLVDGVLRFFHRVHYDHTEYEQSRSSR